MNAFFTPARNYFTGALAPGVGKETSASPFYTAAEVPKGNYSLWLFSGLDGQVHWLDGVSEHTQKPDWGSDIAAVRNPCGTGSVILATESGEVNDSLRPFVVADRAPVAAGQAAMFSGPLTALWAEENGNNAVAVSRNLESGNYEAFRLSLTCGL